MSISPTDRQNGPRLTHRKNVPGFRFGCGSGQVADNGIDTRLSFFACSDR